MRAGQLRHRLIIQHDIEVGKDAVNQPIIAPATFATVWGAVRPLSGRELVEARQVQSDVTHAVEMRSLAGLTSEMRIIHKERILEIAGPPQDFEERGIKMDLLCIERT